MRSMKRLRNTDFKKIQKSLKQKTQKQAQTLKGLIELPDYDVIEFFQALMKNQNYEQILNMIPEQKKIDFFSKNFQSFLQTQDELLALRLPQLKQIPKAKQFHLKLKQQQKLQQNIQQASVIQIIDSFSTHVLQKNTEQVLRIYRIILQMKQHSKYKEYFYNYSINKIFRESYISFVENCDDVEILIRLKQEIQAIKVYFKHKTEEIFEKINTDLKIDSSVFSLRKTLSFLLHQIYEQSQNFKVKFSKNLQSNSSLTLYLSKWINDLSKAYYHSVQSFIYGQQEISQILKNLGEILQTSKQLQTDGISLYRQLRNLISIDLPLHLQKIIEVVLQSFDDILKYNNQMFEFVQFKKLNSMSQLIDNLSPITKKDYGKKCCSQKGILLINSFLMILLPLCDEKWSFLHQNILQNIVDKVKATIDQQKVKLPMWDYYHLYNFFNQLMQGKVKHRVLFDSSNSSYLKQKITKVKKLSQQCRYIFQNKLIANLWSQVLCGIPQLLWEIKSYAEAQKRAAVKPTTFSIALVFSVQQFFKQIQFRLIKQHFQYLGIQIYQYIVYVLEYILFYTYHDKGRNMKVFTLYKKQQKLLNKARDTFPIEESHFVKISKILKMGYFTKFGLQRLVIDIYFFTDIYKILLNGCQKIKADQFVSKIAKVLSGELKNQPLQTDRKQYNDLLRQFTNVYEKQPQKMKQYLNQKRRNPSLSTN